MQFKHEELYKLQEVIAGSSADRWVTCIYCGMRVDDIYHVSTILCDCDDNFIAVHVLGRYDCENVATMISAEERDLVMNIEEAVLLVNDSFSALREEIDACLKEQEKRCNRSLELLEELGDIMWDYPAELCLDYEKVTDLMTKYYGVDYAIKMLHEIYLRHDKLGLKKGDKDELSHRLCVAESVICVLKTGKMTLETGYDTHITVQLNQIASVQFRKVSNTDVCIIEMSNGTKYDVNFNEHPFHFEQLKYLFD